jgi:betaine-aldehyde dehydrogenase
MVMTTIAATERPSLPEMPRRFDLLIDGAWRPARKGDTLTRSSPAHDLPVSTVPLADADDAGDAILAARRAFDAGPWPRLSGAERGRFLARVAGRLAQRSEDLALLDVLESGKPIAQARGEIAAAVELWRYASQLARDLHGEAWNSLGEDVLALVVQEPIGVVAIITPWNFPFLIVSQKLPFALAAGCTAVVKPSELTSASTLLLGEILLECGLPPGVVNIVTGRGPEVGAPLVRHPAVDMVSFTGSTAVGRATVAAASTTLKRVAMELGGKNPQLVFADADLEAVVDAVLFGVFFNAGECCNSGSRLLVERRIADELVAEVVRRSAEVVVGDPLDPATKVGAIITPEHLEKIEGYVTGAVNAGARLRTGGRRLATAQGRFMAPTVVDKVAPGAALGREEVFGPVLAVLTFETADEAIALANDSEYGLSAGVWTRDMDTAMRCAREVRAGTVWINRFMDGYPELPFGGFRQSGIGRELGRHAARDFTETKTVQLQLGARKEWWLPRPTTRAA